MRATKEAILNHLRQIKGDLAKEGISAIGLFGSYAKDEQTVYSDIDIAIGRNPDFLRENNAYAYFNLIDRIKENTRKKFHRNVDIFDLDSASEFAKSIREETIYV